MVDETASEELVFSAGEGAGESVSMGSSGLSSSSPPFFLRDRKTKDITASQGDQSLKESSWYKLAIKTHSTLTLRRGCVSTTRVIKARLLSPRNPKSDSVESVDDRSDADGVERPAIPNFRRVHRWLSHMLRADRSAQAFRPQLCSQSGRFWTALSIAQTEAKKMSSPI